MITSSSTASISVVAEGTVFALLGPNGAGKTTTVRSCRRCSPTDGGAARVDGHDVTADPDEVRKVIGVTGQFSAVDNLLTGEENLLLMADLQPPRTRPKVGAAQSSCCTVST